MKIKVSSPYKNLYLVDLDQDTLTGFRSFISSWIYKGVKTSFVVDPGPSNTINILIESLKRLDIVHLDYILLTHIHLDHGGGTGSLLKEFPMAKVICQSKGISHMIDPKRLYQSSLEVLGDLARTFGPVQPVPAEKIFDTDKLNLPEGQIYVFPTPGHAPHHQSFLFNGLLFCGEALGTTIPTKKDLYLRLATPPVFKYDIFRNSIQIISDANPDNLCMAHYGFINNPDEVIRNAIGQLDHWLAELQNMIDAEGIDPSHKSAFQYFIDHDPRLSIFKKLPLDIQEREWYFSGNSIKGMVDYLLKLEKIKKKD